MGNRESSFKKSKENSVMDTVAKTVSESDDEEEEHLEIEVCESSNGESAVDLRSCERLGCLTDQMLYTLVEDYITDVSRNGLLKMPENIRHESVFEYIKAQEKLVVRFRTKVIAENKNLCSVAADAKEEYSMIRYGTGCVYISSDTLQEYEKCPLFECKFNNGQTHKCYGGMIVYTNKHVVENNEQAGQCKVDFFYYKEISNLILDDMNGASSTADNKNIQDVSQKGTEGNDTDGQINNAKERVPKCVTAYGYRLQEDQKNKDLISLRILYHDPELYTIIKTYSQLRLGAWSKIPKEIKLELKKHAIIVSHPHGRPKQISFGGLISLEVDDNKEKGRKVTAYNAATCSGSSGAPVLTGHYSYRPFVHSSKIKVKRHGQVKYHGASYSY